MTATTIKDPELRQQLERLEARFERMEKDPFREGFQDLSPSRQRQVIQQSLSLTPPKEGVPNSMLRGALFAAIQGKDRRYLHRSFLATQKGLSIRFTGMQLDQSDLDVWEHAVRLARQHPLGTRCYFAGKAFLKGIGRSVGKTNVEWLKDALARLAGCAVEMTYRRKTYGGSLLEFIREEDTNRYVLVLNATIMSLYSAGWTEIDWEQRKLLKRKPLALWLHGFYASHAAPHPLKIETIHRLCGSHTQVMRKFKQNLIEALEELVKVEAIVSFEIKDGLVSVERAPSSSQYKHMIKDQFIEK